MSEEPQQNLYRVIFQKTQLRVSQSAEKLPDGSMAIISLVAGGFLAACERAAQILQEEHPDMRIITVKEVTTNVRL